MPMAEHETQHQPGRPTVHPDPQDPPRRTVLHPVQQFGPPTLQRRHRVRVTPERKRPGDGLVHKDPRRIETRDFHAPSLREQPKDPNPDLDPGPDLDPRREDQSSDGGPSG